MRKLVFFNIFKVPSVVLFDKSKKKLSYFLNSLIISLLSLLFAHIIIYNLEDISSFVSPEKSGDFQISDIYNAIADYRNVSEASQSVTVVAVDQCSRQELLDVLELVSEYNPRVIGLDVFFRVASNDSMQVISTLSNIPNLVLPCMLEKQNDNQYQRLNYSFVEKYLDSNYGYVNLNASSASSVIRDFTPYVKLSSGDTLLQMATAMAQIASSTQYEILRSRNNSTEIIKFSSIDIPIVSSSDILSGDDTEYLSRYLADRAVIIGDVHNINDMYFTPLNGLIPGVLIHAYALNTILSAAYTNCTPSWLNISIALLLVLCFIFVNTLAKEKWRRLGNLVMRIVQITLMFAMVIIGSYWYSHQQQYLDFSLVVLMLGFSSLAADVYDGLLALYFKIKKVITKTEN